MPIKLKVKFKKTDHSIKKVGNLWICPYCKKSFGNRKGNLRSHLKFIRKNLLMDKKVCISNPKEINIDILEKQIKSIEVKSKIDWVKPIKPNNKESPNLIHNFESIETTVYHIDEDWKYYDLETVVFKLIKATYLSDIRWKDNCIVTWSEYYKIKQEDMGWCHEMEYDNKLVKITKSFFTRFIFRKMISYLCRKHRDWVKEQLKNPISKEFYRKYVKFDKRAPLEDQRKLHRLFLKRQRKKKVKNKETEIIEFSDDSSLDIPTRPKTPPPPEPIDKIALKGNPKMYDKYQKMKQEETLNHAIVRITNAILANEKSKATGTFLEVGTTHSFYGGNEDDKLKELEKKEYVLSRLPDGPIKNHLIVLYEEERNMLVSK
jgi:hypothetical protein